MPGPSLDTVRLVACIDRMRGGDAAARDELCRAVTDRLTRIARRMLKSFPNVRQFDDTDDVFQGAIVRLLRTLQVVNPPSTRDFFNLAANHVRRELLDLARRYAVRPDPVLLATSDAAAGLADSVADLDRWAAFHEAVEGLPGDEREVMGLVFYHGWSQAQVAELFGVTERTVRRWWQSACLRLGERLGGRLPEPA